MDRVGAVPIGAALFLCMTWMIWVIWLFGTFGIYWIFGIIRISSTENFLFPQWKSCFTPLKSINKTNIRTNISFIYINISFILTNISLIYSFLRRFGVFLAKYSAFFAPFSLFFAHFYIIILCAISMCYYVKSQFAKWAKRQNQAWRSVKKT